MSRPQPGTPESLSPTSWTDVRQAGAQASPGGAAALDALLRRYWPALVAHLVHKRKLPLDRAEDLVQSFIQEKILARNLLQTADPRKGKFRTYLLTALDRFAIDCWRREAAAAPAGELPAEVGEDAGSDVFDVAWAMQVLVESVGRMRAECASKRRPDLWGVFAGRALAPLGGSEPVAYPLLAERLGLDSAKQAANRYVIAEAMFRRNFRSVLGENADGEAEDEARDFRRIVAQAGAELLERLRVQFWNDVPEVTLSADAEPRTDVAALTRLLELPRQPVDAAAQLQHVLTAPLPLDLGAVDAALAGRARAWAEGHGLALRSFGELLHHPEPLPELLELAKEFAKENRNDPESPLSREVATVLYYASIAAALARCGRRITRHDDATLRQGLHWGCMQPWVDEATRCLLRDGLERLGGSEEPPG
jgi:RNA polymerase sigma-70 factor (ECF subfamily)